MGTFRFFDKDRTGTLNHQELKSCLRSMSISLPVVEEGQSDPLFEAILAEVDPNGDGTVSLGEYLNFMIRRETENVESAQEVNAAFRVAAGDKDFILEAELRAALTDEQAEYCVRKMQDWVDGDGVRVVGSYDYQVFTRKLFSAKYKSV